MSKRNGDRLHVLIQGTDDGALFNEDDGETLLSKKQLDRAKALYERRFKDQNATCQICGKKPKDVDDNFLVMGEVTGGFTFTACFDCTCAFCASVLSTMPLQYTRRVMKHLLMEGDQRNDAEQVSAQIAGSMAGLFGVMNPTILTDDEED